MTVKVEFAAKRQIGSINSPQGHKKHKTAGGRKVLLPTFKEFPVWFVPHFDAGKFVGENLRKIRSRKTNFKGEIQR